LGKEDKAQMDSAQATNKEEFIPVIYDGKPDKFPIPALCHFTIANPATIPMDPRYSSYVILKREGKEETVVYIEPSVFEKYILAQNYTLEDAKRVRESVLSNLQELKSAWVQLGTSIIAVQIPRLYRTFGYETFEEYCEKELKLHRATVYEIINSTLLMMRYKPDVYKKLMAGQKEADKTLPSYHSLALLKINQRQLEKRGKFDELLDMLLTKELSTREFQSKMAELLGKKKRKMSLKEVRKQYEALYRHLKEVKDIPQNVLERASSLVEELKKLDS
jgi:hypothetical protein